MIRDCAGNRRRSKSCRCSQNSAATVWIAHKSPRICERCRLSVNSREDARITPAKTPQTAQKTCAIHQSRRGKRPRSEQLPADRRAWRGVASNAPGSRERLPSNCPAVTALIECGLTFSVPLPPPAAQPATGSSKYRRQPKISPLPTR